MKKTILFQGDSITDCGRVRDDNPNLYAQLGWGYPAHVASRLLADRRDPELAFFNRGISGNRTPDLYARWKIDALNLEPDLLSILIGVNDTWHEFYHHNGVEVDRGARILEEILLWTRRALPACRILLMEPFVFPIGVANAEWLEEVKLRAAEVRRLAEKHGLAFLPLQERLEAAARDAGCQEFVLPDGVHPSLAGHQIIADAWLEAAAPLL